MTTVECGSESCPTFEHVSLPRHNEDHIFGVVGNQLVPVSGGNGVPAALYDVCLAHDFPLR